jgi:hypothetical protein
MNLHSRYGAAEPDFRLGVIKTFLPLSLPWPDRPGAQRTQRIYPLSRFENTPQLAPLSTSASDEKAGLAAQFLDVEILDSARLAARCFIIFFACFAALR